MLITSKVCFIESLYEKILNKVLKFKKVKDKIIIDTTPEYCELENIANEIINKSRYITPLLVNKETNEIKPLSHEEIYKLQLYEELKEDGTMSIEIKEINGGKDYQIEIYHYGTHIKTVIDDYDLDKIEKDIKSLKEGK